MVLDIKMEDFQRKSCLVAEGHMTHTPDTIICSSVVTRETVCIPLTMAVLHDLKVKAAEVLNTYVMEPNCEKIWTLLGLEFGDGAGKSAIVVRAYMGLRVQVPHLGHILHNASGNWVLLLQCRP